MVVLGTAWGGGDGFFICWLCFADFVATLVGFFDSLSLDFFVCGVEKMAVPKL